MAVPAWHRTNLRSTNTLERLNKEVKRRADGVGLRGLTRPSATVLLAAHEGSVIRLIGGVLLEANDEWALQHQCLQIEHMAEMAPRRSTPSPLITSLPQL
jgi:transposase-like protein